MTDFNGRVVLFSVRDHVMGLHWGFDGERKVTGRAKPHGAEVTITPGRQGDYRILLTVGDVRMSAFCADAHEVGRHVRGLLDGYVAYAACLQGGEG